MTPQTYANHRRLDPIFHGVLGPLYLAALVIAGIFFARQPDLAGLWRLLVTLGLFVHWLMTRVYALRVQDRIIRLEEQLRMARLLPPDLLARALSLRPSQYVGLRFASDEELADRVGELVAGDLSGEAIKKRIRAWRPDTFRV